MAINPRGVGREFVLALRHYRGAGGRLRGAALFGHTGQPAVQRPGPAHAAPSNGSRARDRARAPSAAMIPIYPIRLSYIDPWRRGPDDLPNLSMPCWKGPISNRNGRGGRRKMAVMVMPLHCPSHLARVVELDVGPAPDPLTDGSTFNPSPLHTVRSLRVSPHTDTARRQGDPDHEFHRGRSSTFSGSNALFIFTPGKLFGVGRA